MHGGKKETAETKISQKNFTGKTHKREGNYFPSCFFDIGNNALEIMQVMIINKLLLKNNKYLLTIKMPYVILWKTSTVYGADESSILTENRRSYIWNP